MMDRVVLTCGHLGLKDSPSVSFCKPCRAIERYRNDPEFRRKNLERNKKSYHDDPVFRQRSIRRAMESKHRRWYGITPEDYSIILEKQNGRCAICKTLPSKKKLAVDHDHATGMVRGLLCLNCNTKLPIMENEDTRQSAMEYLGVVTRG